MKKLLIILYILIFVALAYYVVTLFIDRDFTKANSDDTQSEIESSIDASIEDSTETNNQNTTLEDVTNTVESISASKDAQYSITRVDCDNNCDTITNTDKKEYCIEICGLSPIQNISGSCDDLTELKKDYCLRDQAITQNDINKCQEIQDGGIEKQCLNRINEDFIDDIM